MMREPSEQDKEFYRLAREHINRQKQYFLSHASGEVLEIGPDKIKRGTNFRKTLDIVEGCDYQEDITRYTGICSSSFDIVLCQEVLEHTVNPYAAIDEIRRILRPGGLLLASSPLNFRIHGPQPDCWRFTEHGIRVLMCNWDDVVINALESDRFLFPIHYNWSARCNKEKSVDPRTLKWRFIT
jgi:SAM-dependent methyltransferase